MNVNLSVPLVGLDGKQILPDPESGLTVWTVGNAAANAVIAPQPGGTKEPVVRLLLAQRIYGGGDHVLTAEEKVMIKDSATAAYGPLVAGQIHLAVDPPATPAKSRS